MNYWLYKSEPDTFGIEHLKKMKRSPWDGVRNFQARNNLRAAKKGDLVIFYHSSCAVPAAVGIAEVVKESYPDLSAWNPESPYYDAKTSPQKPQWYMVDVRYKKTFRHVVTLAEMRSMNELVGMTLLQKGSRLSIQPVSKKHFEAIVRASES